MVCASGEAVLHPKTQNHKQFNCNVLYCNCRYYVQKKASQEPEQNYSRNTVDNWTRLLPRSAGSGLSARGGRAASMR